MLVASRPARISPYLTSDGCSSASNCLLPRITSICTLNTGKLFLAPPYRNSAAAMTLTQMASDPISVLRLATIPCELRAVRTRFWCPAYRVCSQFDGLHRKKDVIDIRKQVFQLKRFQPGQNFQTVLALQRFDDETITIPENHHAVAGEQSQLVCVPLGSCSF